MQKMGLILAAIVMAALAVAEVAFGVVLISVGMVLAGSSMALLGVSSAMVAVSCAITSGDAVDDRFRSAGAAYRAALMRCEFRAARGLWVEQMSGPFRKGSRARPWSLGAIGLGIPAFIAAYVGVETADGEAFRRLVDLFSRPFSS